MKETPVSEWKDIISKSIFPNLAVTHNENTVIARDDPALLDDHLKREGFQLGQQKRLIAGDFYQNWDDVYASVPTEQNDLSKLPGYYNLLDFNADGIITGTEDTPPVGYSGVPQNTANLSLGASYRGFSAMVQFFGVNNASRWIPLLNYFNNYDNLFEHVSDYWSKDNPDATSYLPRWQTQGENVGHYHLYDASFLRLRTAEISYSFRGTDWAAQVGIDNFRIFLNGNNLLFWSNLPDDRETTHRDASAIDGAYPTTKRINLGIDITF